jgi:hypothetical protein
LQKECEELDEMPEAELEELTMLYAAKGLTPQTARMVAEELTEHDAFVAHVDVELGIDPEGLSNPWQAALSSRSHSPWARVEQRLGASRTR